MELPIPPQFQILERLPGHTPLLGKSAGQELNWAYRLKDVSSSEICVGMFCKPNHLTLMSESTWEDLQKPPFQGLSWYISAVGYPTRTVKEDDECPYTYLHQLILNHFQKGRGKESVDHINQNKLDNRLANLRVTTQSIQNQNRGKVSRHSNARELPLDISEPLPKFCIYYKESLNKEKTRWREFFTIEGHPAQKGARKATTKSNRVSILDKLKEAKHILTTLDRHLEG